MHVLYFFKQGGPIMWPLLISSITALTVVFERIFFIVAEKKRRNPKIIGRILALVHEGDIEGALRTGQHTEDSIAKVLIYGLEHREESLPDALIRAAKQELKR